jgi:hypothetical protein
MRPVPSAKAHASLRALELFMIEKEYTTYRRKIHSMSVFPASLDPSSLACQTAGLISIQLDGTDLRVFMWLVQRKVYCNYACCTEFTGKSKYAD